MIEFPCPACKAGLRAAAEKAGKPMTCPKCKAPIQVPALAAPAKAAPAAKGLTTPVKVALIGGTSVLLLSCFLCCGVGSFVMFLRPSAAKEQVARAKAPAGKAGADAKQAKAARAGKGKTGSGGFNANDADLLDFEERCKVLTTRIKLGMSKGQVEAILGFPDDEDEKDLGDFNPAKAGQILETWTWRDDLNANKFIMVGFVNGALTDAETNALGQFGWNITKGYRTKPLGK